MKGKGRRFDTEHFVAACRASLADSDVLRALAATVADALQDREGLLEAFGSAPTLRVTQLVADEHLTVLHLGCPVGFAFPPHDHRMLSVVGVFAGIEDNIYYARQGECLVEVGRHRVRAGEVAAHSEDVIHAITNAGDEPLGAIHVYAGDFLHLERSEWSGEPLQEQPYDLTRIHRLIERSGPSK